MMRYRSASDSCNSLSITVNLILALFSGDDTYPGDLTSFGTNILNKTNINGIGSTDCLLMTGSDGQGKLYQAKLASCPSLQPTICRKNIGNCGNCKVFLNAIPDNVKMLFQWRALATSPCFPLVG
jgi:hypothetical protein